MPKIKKFKASAISRLKLPEGKSQVDYFETLHTGRSLIMTLNKSGRMSWSSLFYDGGRPRRKKLGEYPAMSVRAARQAAVKLDVAKTVASSRAGSFEAVAETYLKRYVRARGLRSESEIIRLLKSNVYPRWARKRFAEIGRRDVAELLDRIEDDHGAGVADSTLAIIRGLMRWYQTRDDDYVCF